MDIKGTYCGGYGTNKQTVRRYDRRPPTAADIGEAIRSQLDAMRVFAWFSGDPRELADLHQHNELTRLVEWAINPPAWRERAEEECRREFAARQKPSCNLAPGA